MLGRLSCERRRSRLFIRSFERQGGSWYINWSNVNVAYLSWGSLRVKPPSSHRRGYQPVAKVGDSGSTRSISSRLARGPAPPS